MTLHNFRQLRELELMVKWPSLAHNVILSSITSTELRKIVFTLWNVEDRRHLIPEMRAWVSTDEQLCGLVDRLHATGYRHTLEVELRLAGIGSGAEKDYYAEFLPEFREKGAVIITDDSAPHCLPCSR